MCLTVLHVKANTDFSWNYSTTVPFYVGQAVNVYIGAVVHDAVNTGWCATLCVVKREVPSLTAGSTTRNSCVSDVNHSEIGVASPFSKVAFLKQKVKVTGEKEAKKWNNASFSGRNQLQGALNPKLLAKTLCVFGITPNGSWLIIEEINPDR